MRLRTTWPSVLLLVAACLPENPIVEDDGGTETGETGGEVVESGLLGCPSDSECTIVAVSQTIDDRVELFTAVGPGPVYRGALDLDLKPNPGGDISGEFLDEPYGLAWDGAALHVLIGHYPSRAVGSLLSFPAVELAEVEAGATVPLEDWFVGGEATGLGVRLTALDRTEPLSMLVHAASGSLLIAVFANDLMLPDAMWQTPSELPALGPWTGNTDVEPRVAVPGCAGAWNVIALDEDTDAVALACDGDERVAILDVTSESEGAVASPRCVGEIPFSDKRVRYLAADGLGGVVLGENPPIVSASEDSRLWWFDGDCQVRGFSTFEAALSWQLRDLERIPADSPRWLLAQAEGDAGNVMVLAGDASTGEITECGRLDGLASAGVWTADGGSEPLRPHALALSSDGRGLAISAAPADYANAEPGYASVWWTPLDYADDPCDAVVVDPVELAASAPAVDATIPKTWRRAPDVLTLIEL
jgi:hypothetical protein